MAERKLPDSVVQAFGGNALKEDGSDGNTIEAQERAMGKAAKVIAAIHQQVQKTLVVHGNGPQIGWILARSAIANGSSHNMHPVHVAHAGAASQGAIGLGMAKMIANANDDMRTKVIEVGTQVLVDKDDPAFQNPSKPIGNWMSPREAIRKEREFGHVMQERSDAPDITKPFRRVVASPEPIGIEEIDLIELLVNKKTITIALGGGGIPFILDEDGKIEWVPAVIDKDKAAALAAIQLGIKFLAIFTAENGIYTPGDFKRKQAGDISVKPIPQMTAFELGKMVEELPSGSMGPKAEALRDFAETGNEAWVGPLVGGEKALFEGGGTMIRP